MKIDVLDLKGKTKSTMDLNDSVFGVTPSQPLLAQYLKVFLANQRQGNSSTKTRSEVRGGGRKPWRQKGTGRARHGSIRSPIWAGGGVAHGPKPKSWRLSLPKSMKRAAIVSALSLKAQKNQVKVLDKVEVTESKTKAMAEVLKNVKAHGKVLVVLGEKDDAVLKSASNLKKVKISLSENLNGYDLMNANTVVFAKDAVTKLEEKYGKTK